MDGLILTRPGAGFKSRTGWDWSTMSICYPPGRTPCLNHVLRSTSRVRRSTGPAALTLHAPMGKMSRAPTGATTAPAASDWSCGCRASRTALWWSSPSAPSPRWSIAAASAPTAKPRTVPASSRRSPGACSSRGSPISASPSRGRSRPRSAWSSCRGSRASATSPGSWCPRRCATRASSSSVGGPCRSAPRRCRRASASVTRTWNRSSPSRRCSPATSWSAPCSWPAGPSAGRSSVSPSSAASTTSISVRSPRGPSSTRAWSRPRCCPSSIRTCGTLRSSARSRCCTVGSAPTPRPSGASRSPCA